ncbi:MAG: patatin-like phospholipase family protein [Bacteroidota bacterium]
MDSSEHAFYIPDAFTSDLEDVIASEKEFLDQRRKQYALPELDEQSSDPYNHLWGLAISGGGIRSATLGLGMIQKFIAKRIFKQFDYMSTVSGGGYIGSCLTTLMSTDPEKFVQPGQEETGQLDPRIPGVEIDTSPFSLLMRRLKQTEDSSLGKDEVQSRSIIPGQFASGEGETSHSLAGLDDASQDSLPRIDLSYHSVEETKLDARHQLHHLRMHGEYLTPQKSFLSPDVQRAVGTVLAGIIHNIFLFALTISMLVSFNYLLFDWVSKGHFFQVMDQPSLLLEEGLQTSPPVSPEAGADSVMGDVVEFWDDHLALYFSEISRSYEDNWVWPLGVATLGFLVSIFFQIRIRNVVGRISTEKQKIKTGATEPDGPSGMNTEAFLEQQFVGKFQMTNIVGSLLVMVIALILGFSFGWIPRTDYWLMFVLPICFTVGIFAGVYTVVAIVGANPKQGRITRAFYGDLRGGAFTGVLISLILPFGLLLLFAFSFYLDELYTAIASSVSTSVASIGVGYFAASSQKKGEGGKGGSTGIMSSLAIPLLSLSILVFVILSAAAIALVLNLNGDIAYFALWLFGGSLLTFVILGSVVDSNKLSLHYFYRDRLSEAYLRTDGRVLREEVDRQGMPLVNLRNDEDLRLKDVGWSKLSEEDALAAHQDLIDNPNRVHACRFEPDGDVLVPNPRGPYHLVVTALNLQGSDELVRKDLKSDHFIFSRNYIGSRSTGYVKTDAYRDGRTKLARAMAISAAAVSSGMGFTSFFAQAFLTTLLNLRLGYWIENPWYYRYYDKGRAVNSWLTYRLLKLQGWKDMETKDIAEEGDNSEEPQGKYRLYFNPKRRFTFWPSYLLLELLGGTTADTRLINVSDGGHTGDNLGLVPLLRRKCKVIVICDFEQDNSFTFESFNHAIRMANIEENIDIHIDLRDLEPETIDGNNITPSKCSVVEGEVRYPDYTTGKIFYIKSSLNIDELNPLPVNIYNYHKKNPDFPHQSTADQYFDDAQFEAYRALGFHMAGEASAKIHDFLNMNS